MNKPQFILFTVDGYLFPVCGGYNRGAVNISVHVFWWAYAFVSVEYVYKIGIAGSKSMHMFRFT